MREARPLENRDEPSWSETIPNTILLAPSPVGCEDVTDLLQIQRLIRNDAPHLMTPFGTTGSSGPYRPERLTQRELATLI